mgnify:FL=1
MLFRSWNFVGIQDEGVSFMSAWKQIEELNFNVNQISPRAMSDLAKLPKLVHLNIGDTPAVNDEHLKAMPQLTALRELYVANTSVTDEGLTYLHPMRQLTVLHLGKTKVTAKGVDDLHRAIPSCKIIWDGGVVEPEMVTAK